jgi:hypothetical protein
MTFIRVLGVQTAIRPTSQPASQQNQSGFFGCFVLKFKAKNLVYGMRWLVMEIEDRSVGLHFFWSCPS